MNETQLRDLALLDDSPAVRSSALVELAGRVGRNAMTSELLEAFIPTQPASADRVRIARAWLLAK
jgi:hypothetical protein